MRILLSGYGAMGKIVAQIASERHHEIVGVFSILPIENCPYPIYSQIDELPSADVIIDFSHPNNITPLLETADSHQTPLVIATTGARETLQQMMDKAAQFVPIFFSANMSYGVHVFTEVLKFLTPLLQGYDIEIIEKHHHHKVDAPSGTAIKLLEAIQEVNPNFYPIYDRSQISSKRQPFEIGMSAIRGGSIVGEHDVIFAGDDEIIEITHRAQSKHIFANGALLAAEKLVTKAAGFYTFHNL